MPGSAVELYDAATARLIEAERRHAPRADLERYSFDEWMFDSQQFPGYRTSWGTGERTEGLESSFSGYVGGGYKGNSVVFAVIGARMRLFSEARFQYQRIEAGRPTDLWADQSLAILDTPWPGAVTGDLLARMEQDASLAGTSYTLRQRDRLRRLRPDWTDIVIASPSNDPNDLDAVIGAYLYKPGGVGDGIVLLPEQVAQYSPIPDPAAHYRGMSWLTPVIEEIRSDTAATRHKGKFFDNAATPNLAVSLDKSVSREKFLELVDAMKGNTGADNAYKTLWLAGGADVKVIGADLKQLDFKLTQGAGETRIAAAGGVPPIIVGLSEGLQASTYSNYGQAKRAFADLWARPAWRQVAGALSAIVPAPKGSRLWYDDRDIPYLQDDLLDESQVNERRAGTIRQLVDAGYEPATVVAAVMSNDFTKLQHSGLYSVQLQAPGSGDETPAARAREVAEILQKAYLAVGPVVSGDEVRDLVNLAGAGLTGPAPSVA